MEITGRLTADAEVRKIKNNREVVSFTVAVNDYYKPKDGEAKEFEEYFNCSYWLSAKIADNLLKGSLVTVTGRVHLNQYEGKDGKHYASLAVYVDRIKILAKGGKKTLTASTPATEEAGTGTTNDDLPF
jgi:single-strand DNA-binding protein